MLGAASDGGGADVFAAVAAFSLRGCVAGWGVIGVVAGRWIRNIDGFGFYPLGVVEAEARCIIVPAMVPVASIVAMTIAIVMTPWASNGRA